MSEYRASKMGAVRLFLSRTRIHERCAAVNQLGETYVGAYRTEDRHSSDCHSVEDELEL